MKFNLSAASLVALALFVGQGFADDTAKPADQPAAVVVPDKPAAALAVPAEVLALIADARAASELSVEELQARMKQARHFAKDENLPPELLAQLASISDAAKAELVSREQATKPAAPVEPPKKAEEAKAPAIAPVPAQAAVPEKIVPAPVPDEVQALLNDNRAPADLSVDDLQARADTARKFAKDQSLPPDLRDALKAIAQSSRAEIASRAQAAKSAAPAEPAKKVEAAPPQPAAVPVPQPAQAAAPAQAAPVPDEVQALLNDTRAATDLTPEELQLRARAARKFAKDESLALEVRDKLAALGQSARAELLVRDQQQKQATAPAAQPAAPAAPAPVAEAPAPVAPGAKVPAAPAAPVAEVPAAPAPAIVQVAPPPPAADVVQPPPPPPPVATAAEVKKLDSNAGDPAFESQAKAYLADTAALDKLSDDELRKRLDDARNLMAGNKLSSATEDAVRNKLKTEREVLRARVAQAEAQKQAAALAAQQQAAPPPATPVAGEKAASATAPAQAPAAAPALAPITDPAVQKALAALPPVPPAPPAPPPLPPVTATSTTNNTTIVNNTTTNNIVVINATTPAPVVLRDQRPPEDLQRVELQRRIQVYEDAQYDNGYDQEYRDYWRASVLRDREILRRRMIEERYRRQQQLTLGFSNNNLDISINIDLPSDRPPPPRYVFAAEVDDQELQDVLVAPPRIKTKQRYTVDEIAVQPELRDTVSRIEIDTIRFGYNEAFVREEQLQSLDGIAAIIERIVKKYPNEVFLIEGHTDAPGSEQYNLRLSKLRAEAIKKALVSYYVIPAQNLRTVGLGERFLKIPTAEAEPENRRVSISRITQLLSGN